MGRTTVSALAAILSVTTALAGTATRAGAGFQLPCIGDCRDLAVVEVADLVLGVGLVLGTQDVGACPAFDRDGGGVVTVDEVLAGVRNALVGCPQLGCGDGVVTDVEQCDDGNRVAGDGCDGSCFAEPPGTRDQFFLADCTGSTGSYGIWYAIPAGQEFTAGAEALSGVAVLVSSSPFTGPPEPLIARIREASIDGPLLAEEIVLFGPATREFRTFVFDPPVPTVPGEVYVLELWTPGTRLQWHNGEGQGDCTYPGGLSVLFGNRAEESSLADFAFITYAPD